MAADAPTAVLVVPPPLLLFLGGMMWWVLYGVGKTTHKNCVSGPLSLVLPQHAFSGKISQFGPADMSATLPAKVNSVLPSC